MGPVFAVMGEKKKNTSSLKRKYTHSNIRMMGASNYSHLFFRSVSFVLPTTLGLSCWAFSWLLLEDWHIYEDTIWSFFLIRMSGPFLHW